MKPDRILDHRCTSRTVVLCDVPSKYVEEQARFNSRSNSIFGRVVLTVTQVYNPPSVPWTVVLASGSFIHVCRMVYACIG